VFQEQFFCVWCNHWVCKWVGHNVKSHFSCQFCSQLLFSLCCLVCRPSKKAEEKSTLAEVRESASGLQALPSGMQFGFVLSECHPCHSFLSICSANFGLQACHAFQVLSPQSHICVSLCICTTSICFVLKWFCTQQRHNLGYHFRRLRSGHIEI